MKLIALALTLLLVNLNHAIASQDPMTLKIKKQSQEPGSKSIKKTTLNPKRGIVVKSKDSLVANFVASDEYKDQDFSRLDEEVELLK